jgi:hypothetical protein
MHGTVIPTTDNKTVHALCILDNQDYEHKLRICNTYCFSTEKVDTYTRLNVMLICTLPVWSFPTTDRTLQFEQLRSIMYVSYSKIQCVRKVAVHL